MTSDPPRRFWLLTYPRTASNLLVKILNLENQSSLHQGGKNAYFFYPTLQWRIGETQTSGRHLDTWTLEERDRLRESHQSCFDALQRELESSASQGKNVYVKEHVPWLIEPVAE